MSVDPAALAESVAALVRVPSVNPLHEGPRSGPAGEAAIAEFIADRLRSVGADEVVVDEFEPGRPNVYGIVRGRVERTVVLDVHSDTVTVEHMTDEPFDGRIEDGHVWGRGALDTKASLGVMLALLADWSATGRRPTPTLVVLASAGEEAGGLPGARRFREWAEARGLDVDEMIVAEPTEFTPIHGHKGGVLVRVTVTGASAHSALPHLGRNAIDAMAKVIAAYEAEHERLGQVPPSSPLGPGTLSTATISGGTGGNVIPDRCVLTAGRRIVPGEDPTAEFHRLAGLAEAASPLPVEVESVNPPDPDGTIGTAAFFVASETPLVARLAEWSGTVPRVAPFGTNALRYVGFTDNIAVYGPGAIEDAHQATERVAIADLARLADIYERWLEPG